MKTMKNKEVAEYMQGRAENQEAIRATDKVEQALQRTAKIKNIDLDRPSRTNTTQYGTKMRQFHNMTEGAITRSYMNRTQYRETVGQYNGMNLTYNDVWTIYSRYLDQHHKDTEARLKKYVSSDDDYDDDY